MKVKIKPLIDGVEQEVTATIYDTINSIGDIWYCVTDGKGHYWRVKAKHHKAFR